MANRSGFNPARRNRNTGTGASGHGQDNRLVIANRWLGPAYWEDIGEYGVAERMIQGSLITVVVERTRPPCIHACTVDDLATVLNCIPRDDLRGLITFVLRQPKRKEEILAPCWGRLAYSAQIGRPQDQGTFFGPMVFLNAAPPKAAGWWNASMGPLDHAEFDRLRADGHKITRIKGRFRLESNLETIRNTQLYRTLPHEIGHWVDWLEKVERPIHGSAAKYFRRPQQELEVFAHRYADRTRRRLMADGVIPFARTPVRESDGLRSEDFHI